MNKLPNLETSISPRSIHNTQYKFDLSLKGQSERLIKQPSLPFPERKRSFMKQQQFLKKQLHSVTLNSTNEEAILQQQKQKSFDQQIKQLEITISSWEIKCNEKASQSENLKKQLDIAKNQIKELENEVNLLKKQRIDLQEYINANNSHKQCLTTQQDLKMQNRRLDDILRQALDDNYSSQQKIQCIERKSQQIEKLANSLKQQMICGYCNKLLTNAITIIPCAHTFCNKCVQGYLGQCFVCKDNSKVQATYHNDYINDLAKMHSLFEQIVSILRE